MQTGAEVDIRDSEYVWCVGKVQRVLNKFKVKYVVVKYNKSQKKE